jgi:Tfp pilus assembly protein PilN
VIEVNLLPGASRRASRRAKSFSLSMPSLPGVSLGADRFAVALAAAWVIAPALVLWLFLATSRQRDALASQIETAVQDSTRYAKLIAATKSLQARRDTIAQKVQIIQEIDAGRYVWSHLLDEVSRALPPYTWLGAVAQLEAGPPIHFKIDGKTGNTLALTQFMNDLEASPFIRGVRLTSTERVFDQGTWVHNFNLEADYEDPPANGLETVPLFAVDEEQMSEER